MEPRRVDVLLIGGGVAAARCARTLRRGGFAGSIVLVGEEPTPPYNRPPLSKELLRGEVPDELVLAEPPSWYERRGVELALGTPVIAVDPAQQLAELGDGRRLRFGQCLLSVGAQPRHPMIPGIEQALVLRTLADAAVLRERAVAGGRMAVIGGGFIGVEVAASLAEGGVRATIVELGSGLWGGSLGDSVSEWAARRLADVGVEVRFAAQATSVSPDGVGIDGEVIAADVILAAVGVAPRVELAAAAGLQVDDGIVVDDAQRTSDPRILAAGDVARPRDAARVEHWHAAREGGERAASAMLGTRLPDRRAPWVYSDFAGRHLDVLGSAPPDAEPEVVGDPRSGRFAVAWMGPARGVAQLAVTGHAIGPEAARRLVETGADLAEVQRALVT